MLFRSFTYECTLRDNMEDKDWDEIFKGFDKAYKEDKNKPRKIDSLFDFLAGAMMAELMNDKDNDKDDDKDDDNIKVKTFNLDDASIKDLIPKDFVDGERSNQKEKNTNNEIIESASFGNKEHCLDIDLYDNGNIKLGSDSGKTITIHSSMMKFLLNYLSINEDYFI